MAMTNKELFAQAINEGVCRRIELELSGIDEKVVPSAAHYRRLSDILGFNVRKVADKRTVLKRYLIAAIAAALLLLVGCTAVVYKEQIGEFFTTVYETHIKGSYSEEKSPNNEAIEEYYVPIYIPEGYMLVNELTLDTYIQYKYFNDNGDVLMFEQAPIDSADFFINNEDGYTSTITIGDRMIYCRVSSGTYTYIWNDENYAFELYSDTEINEDEIIKIIDNITAESK